MIFYLIGAFVAVGATGLIYLFLKRNIYESEWTDQW